MSNTRTGRKGFIAIPVEERFWSKVDRRGPDECWPWLASKVPLGYGTFYKDGRSRRATQVAWELHHGRPFPEGLDACHRCDNPPCVNPAHIEPATHKKNMQDAWDRGLIRRRKPGCVPPKTHCKHGHPLSGDNVGVKGGWRYCRECKRIWNALHPRHLRHLRQALTGSHT